MVAAHPMAEQKAVALKAFFRIADLWKLDREARATLLGSSVRSVSRWQGGAESELSRDQLERISYILGVYRGLTAIFGDTPARDEWMMNANSDFGSLRPLDRMLAGNVGDLAFVRAYVDRWSAGW